MDPVYLTDGYTGLPFWRLPWAESPHRIWMDLNSVPRQLVATAAPSRAKRPTKPAEDFLASKAYFLSYQADVIGKRGRLQIGLGSPGSEGAAARFCWRWVEQKGTWRDGGGAVA